MRQLGGKTVASPQLIQQGNKTYLRMQTGIRGDTSLKKGKKMRRLGDQTTTKVQRDGPQNGLHNSTGLAEIFVCSNSRQEMDWTNAR